MQFGSSPRVCKFGYVLLFTVFGTLHVVRLSSGNTARRLGNTAEQQTV